MNVYRLSIGYVNRYVAAEDEAGAIKAGARMPELHAIDFNVDLIAVPGYDIKVVPASNELESMTREQLVQWLKDRDIKHHHNLKDDKLRELVLNHVA